MTTINGNQWLNGLFGVEKENMRVDLLGNIAQTLHPNTFGDKLKHPYITTDFSESQVEMITPPLSSIEDTLGFLETIHDLVSIELKNELLWPQSVPPILPSDEHIPIARYPNPGLHEEEYRNKLAKKYGRKKQVLSGIHFNLSFDENLMKQLWKERSPELDFETFSDAVYLKITRQLLRYRWLYILLFGCSPMVDPSFDLKCRNMPIYLNSKQRGLSFRNSCFGYGNLEELYPDYQSVTGYLSSINQMVENGVISMNKELYSLVRPKFGKDPNHIAYVEVRFIDINPMIKIGITANMLQFIHALAIFGLISDEQDPFSKEYQTIANLNHENVSLHGLDKQIDIAAENGTIINAWIEARRIVQEIQQLFIRLKIEDKSYREMFSKVTALLDKPEKRDVHQLIANVEEKGLIGFHIEKAKEYLADSNKNQFNLKGFEDLELSTQLLLREAIKRGVSIEILDRNENFVRLSRDGNVQYVKQATKTSLDNYASILAMENKAVTKKILAENGIRVPFGNDYHERQQAKSDFSIYKDRAIVVKPKSTNFGVGITILKENTDVLLFERAVDIAFEADSSILIEEFISGKEFRIVVMNDDVVGILHRVPANVTGDGERTIRELVAEKNLDPLRGKGYRTPLEKIQLGEAEQMFLHIQGKDFETIPFKNETVYLRENSNISTGGDSIDYTDEIPDSYKQIAIRAARVMNVQITGLDMIIPDHNNEAGNDNYAIIELNFNPAIHIHCHPFRGKNRKLNEKLLDLLGFKEPKRADLTFEQKFRVTCCSEIISN